MFDKLFIGTELETLTLQYWHFPLRVTVLLWEAIEQVYIDDEC